MSTTIWIVVVAVVAVLLIAALVVAAVRAGVAAGNGRPKDSRAGKTGAASSNWRGAKNSHKARAARPS